MRGVLTGMLVIIGMSIFLLMITARELQSIKPLREAKDIQTVLKGDSSIRAIVYTN